MTALLKWVSLDLLGDLAESLVRQYELMTLNDSFFDISGRYIVMKTG